MNINIEKLQNTIPKPTFSFDNLFEKEVTIHSYDLDCNLLVKPNYNIEGLSYEPQLQPIIQDLMKINAPCIYWFETINLETTKSLVKSLDEFRLMSSGRTVPAANNNQNSNVLYVGIRKAGQRKRDGFTNIAGRIVIHFGYYKVGTTQGLQLCYWAKEKIKLNVIELPKDAEMFLNVLEKELANRLHPLCGRH